MRTAIIGNADEPIIPAFVVWLPMLAGDDEDAACRSASLVDDPSVRQFYDPSRLAGRSIARSLGAEDRVAWDMYLFYPPDSKWTDEPPAPPDWVHQLGGGWADHSRYHRGADLVRQLRRIKQELISGHC